MKLPRWARARTLTALACGVSLLFNTACYTLRPVDTAGGLAPGQRVSLEVSDQGRVRLAEQLGGSVLRVEGTVVAQESDHYVVGVSRVGYLDRTSSNWSGERVRIPRTDVVRVEERKLSPARTGLFAGGIIAGIVAITIGMDWIGFGADDDRRPGDDNPDKDQ